MTKTGEQAAKEAPETAQVLRMADYKPEIGPANIPALPQGPVPGGREGRAHCGPRPRVGGKAARA